MLEAAFIFGKKNQSSQPKQESTNTLTKDYLVKSEWGPEEPYGMVIYFDEDGTFNEYCACETGDARHSGHFEIQGNSVTLKVEKYDELFFEEAKKALL